jgi:ketosteroid isomerase-like protein
LVSQENVEIVRAALDGSLVSGNPDVLMSALDPEVEWIPVATDPEYTVHRGLEDVRTWLLAWAEAFPDMRWESERILDAGGEVVVVIGSLRGRGGASGLDVGTPTYGIVVTVRAGKIVRLHEQTTEEALKAIPLTE